MYNKYFYSLLAFVLFIIASLWGYTWYKGRVQPDQIVARINAPLIQLPENALSPSELFIDFGLQKTESQFETTSVAALDKTDKVINSSISLSPSMEGQWQWESDSRLMFTPKTPWPAGQRYAIKFEKKLFAAPDQMARLKTEFETIPFEPKIASMQFYLDPKNPQLRHALATLSFNYPVEPRSLEDNLSLIVQNTKKKIRFTVTYDANKREAYIYSEPLILQEEPYFVELSLTKGIRPAKGASSKKTVTQTLSIPSTHTVFKVEKAKTDVIRNIDDRPEQLLILETSVGVKTSELQKALQVWQLKKPVSTPGAVTPAVLEQAKSLEFTPVPSEQEYATLHSFRLKPTNENRTIFIQINKGISSYGQFKLENDYRTVIEIPAYPPEISFLHKGSLLALNSEKSLSILARGVPAIKFDLARILPDAINHLVSQTSGDLSNPYFLSPHLFNQNNISEIFSEVRPFTTTDLTQTQYTALNIGKYVEKDKGLFLIKAIAWDPKQNIPYQSVENNRLILVTDMGLLVKDNEDDSHDVFVTSIEQGTPVSQAEVSVLGKNGLPVITRTTDEQGHASFPALHDFKDDQQPTVYVVRKANDVSFIPFYRSDRFLNYSRFDVGGTRSNSEIKTLNAYVFSDRGFYRPGDTVHIGMIVKKAYAQTQAAGIPLELTITNPQGKRVLEKKVSLNESGYLTLDYKTDAADPTGQYFIDLYIVKDGQAASQLGSTSVNIEEFQPDRMRMSAQLTDQEVKGWIAPEKLKGRIQLFNLFGTPAIDRRVTAKIILAPHALQFKSYADYIFTDPLMDPKKTPKTLVENLPETRTNDQGEAVFDLGLGRFDKASYRLTFSAEGFEAGGGRGVSQQATVLVSPLPYLVGYKADGDLSFIRQNSERAVQFIALNPQLQSINIENLKVHLFAQQTVSTLIKKPDGSYAYQSIVQNRPVSNIALDIQKPYALPTQTPGDYLIVVKNPEGLELSQFKFSVTGATNQALQKNAELNVKLEKNEYKPGEEITLQITAPYTGSALMTIERDKVYSWKWFKTDTTRSTQTIQIPNDFQGNGYINIAFIRDFNSNEIFTSPLSYAVENFSVDRAARTVQIQLDVPEEATPGRPLIINYRTDKPAKIIVYAVDEGILQVARYETPDPLAYFFRKRALEVNTQQIVDLILPKYLQQRELSAIGGDSGNQKELNRNLNPFKRKTDAPVVYWSGIIDADSTSRQLTYNIPSYFNGKLRVMAVAAAADAVGAAEKSLEVKGYFIISPNTPTFVAPGDEFTVSVSVSNNLSKTAPVSLSMQANSFLEPIGEVTQSQEIAAKQEKTFFFKLRAKQQLGSADLIFLASSGDKQSQISSSISVRPASPYSTTITSGYDKSSKTIPLSRELYPEHRNITAKASFSPDILISGLTAFLDSFPFICTEQIVSKALATQNYQPTIQALTARQLSMGNFAVWPGSTTGEQPDPWYSVYAMHFLTLAKEKGQPVPAEMMQQGLSYLESLTTRTPKDLNDARVQAYAIYVLTRNENVTTHAVSYLQDFLEKQYPKTWKKDLSSAYLAASWQLLKNQAEAERLISGYVMGQPDETMTFDAQYIALLAQHFPEHLKKMGGEAVMPLVNILNKNQPSTLSASYMIMALNSYPPQSSDISIEKSPKQIRFENKTDQTYFYQVTETGFDKNPQPFKNGVEILREYRDTKGNIITEITLGSEIEVRIQARTLDQSFLSNVALIDLLPGGFEVVRDSIPRDRFDYVDIREDRAIFFTTLTSNIQTIIYRIKATNSGNYITPPVLAMPLYAPARKAQGTIGKLIVKN